MPIWPTVTAEKADLFNKYGRGVVHMGLHVGGNPPYRKSKRHLRALLPPEVVDLADLLADVDDLEREVLTKLSGFETRWTTAPGTGYALTFDGTGSDWKALLGMSFKGEFDGTIVINLRTAFASVAGTDVIGVALQVDGVIDRTTIFRSRRVTFASRPPFYHQWAYDPGPGVHTIAVFIVNEAAVGLSPIQRVSYLRVYGKRKRVS